MKVLIFESCMTMMYACPVLYLYAESRGGAPAPIIDTLIILIMVYLFRIVDYGATKEVYKNVRR